MKRALNTTVSPFPQFTVFLQSTQGCTSAARLDQLNQAHTRNIFNAVTILERAMFTFAGCYHSMEQTS